MAPRSSPGVKRRWVDSRPAKMVVEAKHEPVMLRRVAHRATVCVRSCRVRSGLRNVRQPEAGTDLVRQGSQSQTAASRRLTPAKSENDFGVSSPNGAWHVRHLTKKGEAWNK